jgi:hypothetical protein
VDDGIDGRSRATQVADAPPSSPREPSAGESSRYDGSTSTPEAAHEPAPERDFAPPPARAEPVETDFAGSTSASDSWAPPERSFDEQRPPEPPPAPPAPSEAASSGESAAVPADERQAG